MLCPEGIQYKELFLPLLRSRTSRKEMLKAENKHTEWLESGEEGRCSGLQRKTRLLPLWPLSGAAVRQWARQRSETGTLGLEPSAAAAGVTAGPGLANRKPPRSPPIPGPPLPDRSKNPASRGAGHCGLEFPPLSQSRPQKGGLELRDPGSQLAQSPSEHFPSA